MFASLAIPPAWRPALDRLGQTAPRLAEALLVYALALAVGQVAFMDGFGALLWPLNNAYWMFLFVAWAGVRLGLGGTTVLLGLVALQAGWGTLQGRGFFAQDLHSAGLGYASYMAILALVGWSLAGYLAALEQRRERLPDQVARDRQLMDQVADVQDAYLHRVEALPETQAQALLGAGGEELGGNGDAAVADEPGTLQRG